LNDRYQKCIALIKKINEKYSENAVNLNL